jgi:hypothetical protein
MDAILISSNQNRTSVDDAIRHLSDHKELYWSMPVSISRNEFMFTMYALIHLTGEQVEYRAEITVHIRTFADILLARFVLS